MSCVTGSSRSAYAVGVGVGAGVGVELKVGVELGAEVTVGCGTGVGCGEGASSKQSCHPESRNAQSEDHVMLVLGETETPSGPEVPLYSAPSIVRMSSFVSVEKLVTDNVPEA